MRKDNQGMISIQALWILLILSTLAIALATRAIYTIKVASREVNNTKTYFMAKSLSRIIEVQFANVDTIKCQYKGECLKEVDVPDVVLGIDTFDINVMPGIWGEGDSALAILDEESKININYAPDFILERIFQNRNIVENILQNRKACAAEANQSEASEGNKSDIKEENGCFSTVDDLIMLDSSLSNNIAQARKVLTTFGKGQVNINTASDEVLALTGCPSSLIGKIQGLNSPFFSKETIIATLIENGMAVLPTEANYLKLMENYKLLGTKSDYFSYSIECKQVNGTGRTRLSSVISLPEPDSLTEILSILWN